MPVPGFFPQELTAPNVQCLTLGAGMPSPIERFTVSVWLCNSAGGTALNIEGPLHGFTRSMLTLGLTTSGAPTTDKQRVVATIFAVNYGNVQIVGEGGTSYGLRADINYYDQITSDGLTEWRGQGLTHFLVAVDFIAQQFVVYANDQPVTPHVTGSWHTAIAPNATLEAPWQILPDDLAGVADFWMTPSVLDISNVAVRRQFINADLSAVALPSDGHITVSGSTVVPVVFLHALASGSPSDFVANNGTGPDWSVISGSLAFQPEPGSCIFSTAITPPEPPPTSSLAMDNVLAFAATETSQLVFLDWSDDRGHRFGSPVAQPFGDRGKYRTSAQWHRLGYARDRIFRVTWSVPAATALRGAFIELDTRAKT